MLPFGTIGLWFSLHFHHPQTHLPFCLSRSIIWDVKKHKSLLLALFLLPLILSGCGPTAGTSSDSDTDTTPSTSETSVDKEESTSEIEESTSEIEGSTSENEESTSTPDVTDPWDPNARGVPESIANSSALSSYYADVDWSLGGEELMKSLEDCLDGHALKTISYDEAKDILAESDAYPGKPGYVKGFYTGEPTKSWNREHVWPSSRLGHRKTGPGADPQMLRACDSKVNGGRDNLYYGESGKYTYDPAKYGVEGYRGNAARILFYEACRYHSEGLYLNDTPKAISDTSDNDMSMGKISDLLKWNQQYPLMEDEMPRNEIIAERTGVRNPFIDAPEIANRLYPEYL